MIAERFWAKVTKTPTCWLWIGGQNGHGYGQFGFEGRTQLATRVLWKLTIGPIPDGLCVLHTCDNPPCVRPDHLFLGTQFENSQDMVRKKRHQHGERHTQAKLTDALIRKILASPLSHSKAAECFGVDVFYLRRIRRGQAWKHVYATSFVNSWPLDRTPKTHCLRGHAFTAANTYLNKQGWRECRRCHAIGESLRKQRTCEAHP